MSAAAARRRGQAALLLMRPRTNPRLETLMPSTPSLLQGRSLDHRDGDDEQGRVSGAWRISREANAKLSAYAYLPPHAPLAGVGPLRGLAVGMKDLIDTGDMPTSYGSALYFGHQPKEDAWIVAQLRALGATVIGKTATTEFAESRENK